MFQDKLQIENEQMVDVEETKNEHDEDEEIMTS